MYANSNMTHLEPRAPLNALQLGTRVKSNVAGSISSTSPSAVSSSSSSTDGIGSTFLSLLTQELQNQDPTAPVDSTAMVGQMISLNQLDQLIAINHTLSQVQQGGTGPGAPSGTPSLVYASNKPIEFSSPSTPATAGTQQLPFDPHTMMPLDMTHPGGALATNIPSLNAATWNIHQLNIPQMAKGRK